MVEKVKRKRNYGIDLLRIIAIGMILILHILGKDNVLASAEVFSANYKAAWLMEIGCYGAVNCYALVSGFVGIHGKPKASNIVMLWLQVFFYSVGGTVLFMILEPAMVSKVALFKSFFPVLTRQYWYFTAYFGLFLIIPLLNEAVRAISRKQLRNILILGLSFYSFIGIPFFNDPFQFNNGYSMFWLAILYVLGAYFGKYNTLASVSKFKMLCVYAGCVLITWGGKMLFVRYDQQLPFFVFNKNFLVSYMSPTVLVAAIALLGVFVYLEIGEKAGKIISYIGSLAFGVYIIHEQPFISKYFIKGRFAYLSEGSALEMMVTVIFAMILIFTVCAFLDAARQWMFKMLRVKEAVVFMESKVLKYLKEKDVI